MTRNFQAEAEAMIALANETADPKIQSGYFDLAGALLEAGARETQDAQRAAKLDKLAENMVRHTKSAP